MNKIDGIIMISMAILLSILMVFAAGVCEIVKHNGKYASDCGRFAAFIINTVK